MANNAQIEKAYNAIYDYIMNKCENKDFYKAALKNDIKSMKNSAFNFPQNDLFEVMLSLKETIQKNVAKESGSGNLRKAMMNVLARATHRASNPILQKAYEEDGYTMVCDSYVFIRTNRTVDVPLLEDKYVWLNWKGFMPKIEEMQEFKHPSLKEIKEHIKLNANNPQYTEGYGKSKTIFYDFIDEETGEILTRINAKYLEDMLLAMDGTNFKCYIGKGSRSRTTVVTMVNDNNEWAFACPMRVN
jgi:hypothetical protein